MVVLGGELLKIGSSNIKDKRLKIKINKSMKYYITQHYTIEHKEMYDLTSPINKKYADDNGFEYVSNNVRRCPERAAWWEKIAWLKEFLPSIEDGSYVVWEDNDSINVGGDLKSVLNDGSEWGQVELRGGFGGRVPNGWFNAGVIILINTQDVRDFLQRVWDRNDELEETSITNEIRSQNGTIGKGKKVSSLDIEYNCWYNNEHLSTEPVIKSWHGISYENKINLIKDYIK